MAIHQGDTYQIEVWENGIHTATGGYADKGQAERNLEMLKYVYKDDADVELKLSEIPLEKRI